MLLILTLACGPVSECSSLSLGSCDDVESCLTEGARSWRVGEEEWACEGADCSTALEGAMGTCLAEGDCRLFELGDCTDALTCCTDDGCFYEKDAVLYFCDGFDCSSAQAELGAACGVDTTTG